MRSELVVLGSVLALALVSMAVFGFGPARHAVDPHDSPNRGKFVLGSFGPRWFYWFIGPLERVSIALGLSPLFYNLLGLAFGLASLGLFSNGLLAAGGWAVLLGGAADVLDGRIARAQGVASPRGAFLDSTIDRFAEVAAFIGLAAWYRTSGLALVVVVVALSGSLLVSYTRARGESQGVLCTLGVMQRAERILLVGFGAILDGSVSAALGRDQGAFLLSMLVLLAAGTMGTAVFRTVWIAGRLPSVDPPAR